MFEFDVFAQTWDIRSRALTAGELALACYVFGNQIDYRVVRVDEKPILLSLLGDGRPLGSSSNISFAVLSDMPPRVENHIPLRSFQYRREHVAVSAT